jgi:hypothetical protein
MAAPRYVPQIPNTAIRSYRSPDTVPGRWATVRPGDLVDNQPQGQALGYQGPDQGYVLRLSRLVRERIFLKEGEHSSDVEKGCIQIALKRASIYGRAPVIHDLDIGYRLWGFLGDSPPPDLLNCRLKCFEGVGQRHGYQDLRDLVALVPETTLRLLPEEIERRHEADWTSLLELS